MSHWPPPLAPDRDRFLPPDIANAVMIYLYSCDTINCGLFYQTVDD